MLTQIIDFWFAEEHKDKLFSKDLAFDQLIKDKFENYLLQEYNNAIHPKNVTSAIDNLAYIILFDQFPRNIFRNQPAAFAYDSLALTFTLYAMNNNLDQHLNNPSHKHFFYMPLMHSEDLAIQELSLKKFNEHNYNNAYDYALAHYNIIKRFNRYPHRNTILNRPSTQEELNFLMTPNSSF